MKFNSVEISGFRIYDNPNDANFNFVTEDGNTADFISLFAPNGFGKTSFYDAVEWAVTNNIERFWVNGKNTKNSLNMLRQLNPKQINLLKNYNTENDVWVKITDSKNEVYQNRPLNIPGQRHYDINKDNTGKENIEFLRVILSQEWISRFLKEANGQARYQKFMESNPGLQEIDMYYQSVKALAKANDKKASTLTTSIKDYEDSISETSEKDLLATVNAQIENINKLDLTETIKNIEVTTTKKEIAVFRNKLSDLIADNSKTEQLQELKASIELAQNGNEDLFSRKQYLEAKTKTKIVSEQKETVLLRISDFKKLEATTNEIAEGEKTITIQTKHLKKITNLQTGLPVYNEILSKIKSKNQTKEKHQVKLVKVEENIEISNRKLIEDGEANQYFEKQRLQLSQNLSTLPSIKKQLVDKEKQIFESRNKLDSKRVKSASSKKAFDKIEEQVDELLKVFKEFELGQYSEISLEKNKKQITNLKQLETLEAKELQLKEQLKTIQKRIDSQESLNKSLNEFIASGLALVNKQEADTCPLCEQDYDSHTTLAEKIMNNNALSETLKLLLEERTEKQNQIDNNRNSKKEFIEKIKQFYNNRLDELQSQLKIANELKGDDQNLLDDILKRLKIEEDELLDLKSKFQVESIDVYETDLKRKLEEVISLKSTSDEKLTKDKEANQKLISERNTIQEKIKLLEEEIKSLERDETFTQITLWLERNSDGTKSVSDFFDQIVKKHESEITEIKKKTGKLKQERNELAKKLKTFNEQQLKDEFKDLEKSLQDLESNIATYESHLAEKLFLLLEDIENENLEFILKNKKAEVIKDIERYNTFNIEIKKLSGYSENIMPYLQSEQAKIEQAKYKEELKFVIDTVSPLLNDEIEKTKQHLDERVKAFFYEDLINEIYSKIDPHPSFKKVKFIATFADDSPSLDVYVKGGDNDNDEDSLIPNLYFSTAQINILSLSIFLASALNSKTYDCIFIDDPIQSMDSINVLSTIDLFRSIVVNHKKQIILSTHDENFHNLLKMKIPSKLFKSKFLELKSFGKLRPDESANTSTLSMG